MEEKETSFDGNEEANNEDTMPLLANSPVVSIVNSSLTKTYLLTNGKNVSNKSKLPVLTNKADNCTTPKSKQNKKEMPTLIPISTNKDNFAKDTVRPTLLLSPSPHLPQQSNNNNISSSSSSAVSDNPTSSTSSSLTNPKSLLLTNKTKDVGVAGDGLARAEKRAGEGAAASSSSSAANANESGSQSKVLTVSAYN